jgi:hypothetical protein
MSALSMQLDTTDHVVKAHFELLPGGQIAPAQCATGRGSVGMRLVLPSMASTASSGRQVGWREHARAL